MASKTFTRSFAGGEIAPLLSARLDLTKFQTGLAKCLNFRVTPQGPIENRAGFEYLLQAKTQAILIPFTYNSEQAFALEFGSGYIRFHTLGGTLLEPAKNIAGISGSTINVTGHGYATGDWIQLASVGGITNLSSRWAVVQVTDADHFTLLDLFDAAIAPSGAYTSGGTVARVYEIASPYAVADLLNLHYVQSADVLTIAHQSYAPRELRRLGATNWTLTIPTFAPTVATPGTPAVITGGPGGGTAVEHTYAVTAIAADTQEESLQSASASVTSDLSVAGNFNQVQPAAQAGVVRFNVFKRQSGLYGYVGQTDGAAFHDDNITPDMSKTPPLVSDPFAVGAIQSVSVTAGGSNYGGGKIDTVTLTAGGSGYTSAPTAVATGGDGAAGATFTVTLGVDSVTGITVANAGAGYVSPAISFSGGGPGTGATATATATPIGAVTLVVTDDTGTGAVVEPVVVGGVIQGVRVVSGGHGYTAPVITVGDAFGGSGATFGTPVLTPGTVYPRAVSYFEQRRCFGGSISFPQNVWGTRSATESNMTYSIPTQDDDGIRARIVARQAQVVRHLVPLNDLLAFTSGGVWRLSPASGDALTPSNIAPKQHSSVGASMVQPIMTSSSVLYAPARGAHIREVAYKWDMQKYDAQDVSVLAPHLFDSQAVLQMAYSETPLQVLWTLRADGVMLGMTYQPEQDVRAWHQHTTRVGDAFESVCAIPELDEDGVYVIVRRSINGRTVRYVERQHTRQFATLADAFFVDAGLTYSGAPTSAVNGLWHLEGESVVALADAGVEPAQTVTGGTIPLSAPASTVHVGFGYNCDAQTLPMSIETAAAFGQGVVKNVNEVVLSVYQSSGVKSGPSFERLREYPQRTVNDAYGTPPGMVSGLVLLKIDPKWQEDGSVCVRQADPLPLTIRSITIDAVTGG